MIIKNILKIKICGIHYLLYFIGKVHYFYDIRKALEKNIL